MGKRLLPSHIRGTNRQWKQRKRREWKAVLKAIDTFRMGCAFTPAYERKDTPTSREPAPWDTLETPVKEISQRLSLKTWGR
jgi:hypothetical protein